jgi:3-hydroxybutyryl-CoA dehydrogenase
MAKRFRILEEGIADCTTIDFAMTSLGGFKMGPFQLMDFIGHDVNYRVTESVFKEFFYDPKFKPSFTQKRLFEAGFFGKNGRDFMITLKMQKNQNRMRVRNY